MCVHLLAYASTYVASAWCVLVCVRAVRARVCVRECMALWVGEFVCTFVCVHVLVFACVSLLSDAVGVAAAADWQGLVRDRGISQ